MTRLPRRTTTAAAVCCLAVAAAVGGCGAPGGLAEGTPVPAVSAQPTPEPLWPAWTDRSRGTPGAAVSDRQPPPAPLPHAPAVPPEGLGAVDAMAVVTADKRMKPYAAKGWIQAPGRPGLRPAVHVDLTGDGRPELVVAADTESGRSALTVYRAQDGRIHPVLFAMGTRMAVETLGTDLLVRTATSDGAESAVRYRWDGVRMTVVSDEKRYPKAPRAPFGTDEEGLPLREPAPGASR
ncbi:hypothetical protein [Streptomyces antimicrobicus]|uniref:Lipoprotein n=1 Tax=Streptomyces antimicrobicus TaxID=2883108 RepID=A0ABS8B0I2_9ACTN|nr:hypothetical protein [Streptomyces antimicrobicus]MCB5178124.1 hypothetical protein [Streptomyces antimicrobicus]